MMLNTIITKKQQSNFFFRSCFVGFILLVFFSGILNLNSIAQSYTQSTIPFNWIDISSSPTNVYSSSTDNGGVTRTIPFPFSFYGTEYTSCYVNANGFIRFGGTSTSAINHCLPDATEPNNIIAAYWDNLKYDKTCGSSSMWKYQTLNSAPNRIFVVSWIDFITPASGCGYFVSTQVLLYETTNVIEINLLSNSLLENGNGVIGIENSDGTAGSSAICYAVTSDGSSWRWTPASGTQPPTASDQVACAGGFIPNLTATGTDIKWYSDAGLSNLVYSGTPFTTGQTTAGVYTYYCTQTIGGTESSAIEVTLTILSFPADPGLITGTASVCNGLSGITYSVSPINYATTYNWSYSGSNATINGSGNSITIDFATNSTSGNLKVYGSNTCGDGNYSPDYAIEILPSPTITGTFTGSRCGSGTVDLGATASAGTINWYSSPTGGTIGTGTSFTTPVISTSTTYYCDATASGCTSPARSSVMAIVNDFPTITSTTPGSSCGTGIATLSASASEGLINWYTTSSGVTASGTGDIFNTPEISVTTPFYAEAISGSCVSISRTEILATVFVIPSITSTTPASRCGEGVVTLNATASSGTVNWYDTETDGSLLGSGLSFTTPSISVTTIYYVDATDNGCTTATRTAITATVTSGPSITTTTPGSNCGTGAVTLGATASSGTIYWYAASSGGIGMVTGTSFTTPVIDVTTTYYVDADDGFCFSTPRTPVTATINTPPSVNAGLGITICAGDQAFLSATVSDATGGEWSGGSGDYSPGNTSLNMAYTPSATEINAGIATLTLTSTGNGSCPAATDNIIITIFTTPSILSTTPDSRCGTGTVTLEASSSSGTITWYDSLTGGSVMGTGTSFSSPSISSSISYFVDASSGGCTSSTRIEVVATVYNIPAQPGLIFGSTAVCEGALLNYSVVNTNGVTYTWAIPSDWTITSGAGTNDISVIAGVVSGDITVVPSNSCGDGASSAITVTATSSSVGGTLSGGSAFVVFGNSTGIMTLTGYNGNIVKWQKRMDGGIWQDIVNTTDTYSENPSAEGTWEYRAVVQNGLCSEDYSSVISIVVSSSSGGAITGGSSPICLGISTGTMTLIGYTGTITQWERKFNSGIWEIITNTSETYSETPALAGIYEYRVVVDNGGNILYSSVKTISVDESSVGGILSGSTTICEGLPTGNMSLSGYTGVINKWQKRIDGGSWTDIINTSSSYQEIPVSTGVWEYRAEVQNGVCNADYSSIAEIIVNPGSVGGAVLGGSTICFGSATETLTLTGHTGSIVKWQKRLTSGVWDDIINTNTTYSEIPSSDGTWEYRAEVMNGICASDFSTAVEVVVVPVVSAGLLNENDTICIGESVDFTLSENGGNVLNWEKRFDSGTWENIVNTSVTYTEMPDVAGIWDYRVAVDGGYCGILYSDTTTVLVKSYPGVLGSIFGDTIACTGSTATYTIDQVENAEIYVWVLPNGYNGNSTDTSIIINYSSSAVSDTIKVYAQNSCGVSDISSLAVTVGSLPQITGSSPASRCGSGAVTLGAIASFGTVSWWDAPTGGNNMGTGTSFVTPVLYEDTVFYAEASSGSCVSLVRTPVTVTIKEVPVVSLGNDTSICNTQTVTLDAGNPGSVYLWNNGSTQQQITINTSGTFSVTVTLPNGCYKSDAVVVSYSQGKISGVVKYNNIPVENNQFEIHIYSTTLSTKGGYDEVFPVITIFGQGNYRITQLLEDTYIVKAVLLNQSPGSLYENALNSYFHEDSLATEWEEATALEILCDSVVANINLASRYNNGLAFGHVRGGVFYADYNNPDALGAPVPNVDVFMELKPDMKSVRSLRTVTNGAFIFRNVRWGQYSLRVDIPGFEQLSTYNFEVKGNDTIHWNFNFIVDTTPANGAIDTLRFLYSDKNSLNTSLQLYPNPFSEKIYLINNFENTLPVLIELFNITGELLFTRLIEKHYEGKIEISLESFNLPDGSYFIRIIQDDRIFIKKLVKINLQH